MLSHTFSLVLAAIFIVIYIHQCECRGMWGSRRKRSDEDDEDSLSGGFEASQRRAAMKFDSPVDELLSMKKPKASIASNLADKLFQNFDAIVDIYTSSIKELTANPKFNEIVSPESIRKFFDMVPGLADNPEVKAVLDSPQFTDPELLKTTILEGINTIKESAPEIKALLSNPATIASIMEQIPPEYSGLLESLLSGDMNALTGVVDNLPGLDPTRKKIVKDLLSGKTTGLLDLMQETLSNPEEIENARQGFLMNPSLAESIGLSMDIVQDKDKFTSYYKKTIGELQSLQEGSDEDLLEEQLRKFTSESLAA